MLSCSRICSRSDGSSLLRALTPLIPSGSCIAAYSVCNSQIQKELELIFNKEGQPMVEYDNIFGVLLVNILPHLYIRSCLLPNSLNIFTRAISITCRKVRWSWMFSLISKMYASKCMRARVYALDRRAALARTSCGIPFRKATTR